MKEIFLRSTLKIAVIAAIAVITSLAVNAQMTAGDKAVGFNLLSGSYSNDVVGYGIGGKFAYNVTDPIRFAGELDLSVGSAGILTYNFLDFSVYGHYLFSINPDFIIYPLVGFGLFRVKGEVLGISASDRRSVLSFGGGIDYAITHKLLLNSELRYKAHGGNHILFAVGLAYKF